MAGQPAYTKTMLCLATSWRPGGSCVAGRVFADGKSTAWLRPVNPDNGNAISASDLQYEDGTSTTVLDIVSMPFMEPKPDGHQTENEKIDNGYWWTKSGDATWKDMTTATDVLSGTLWSNNHSSFHGLHDKVSTAEAATFDKSLYLIKPDQLSLVIGDESKFGGGTQRRIRAAFVFNGVQYNFVVTDPWIDAQYAGKEGTFNIAECRVCVSLPEIINGYSTKLAASVITPDRVKKEP
jgi:hypothetical protein